jgi:Xaa-Pro aminopeptidase
VGALHLRGGLTETAVAALFGAPLGETAPELHSERAGGFTFCMSGVNAAQAYAAYQRSRSSVLQPGTLALVHCNSYVDGYWTDITRTFFLGAPDERARAMYATVFDARRAAFEAVRPGVRAAEVDSAAREVIKAHGFGAQFKHATGHGVGFAAIDHNAPPRLHPKSDDVLETGMVFNIEPGIYLEDFGGLRHCDMVAVTADGAELLTPFQTALDELIITTANTTSSAASAQTASRRKA